MISRKKLSNGSQLYLILDKATCGSKNTAAILKKAIKGGIDIVEFRDKISSTKDMIKEAKSLLKICARFHLPLIINDRLDVALSVKADGIHLGQDDMPIEIARRIVGKRKIIGLSCHSIADIKNAQKRELDYLAFGPIFKTKTKPEISPKGVQALKKSLKISRLPIFAIGGITEKNLGLIKTFKKTESTVNKVRSYFRSRGTNIAVCRPICLASDVTKAVKILKRKLRHV